MTFFASPMTNSRIPLPTRSRTNSCGSSCGCMSAYCTIGPEVSFGKNETNRAKRMRFFSIGARP